MKNFFQKFFKKKEKKQNAEKWHKVNTFTDTNLDQIFAEHFTQNGGYFNYVGDLLEAEEVLQNLFKTLSTDKVFVKNSTFKNILDKNKINNASCINSDIDSALIDCECLVAFDGSIMISSDNIKDYKIQNLPKNIIILAKPNQLVSNKSRGLELIRRNKENTLPNNITSLNAKKYQDFLKPEFIKELYLLLIEDY